MKSFIAVVSTLFFIPLYASASGISEYTINIKDHKFEPAVLEIPADTKVKLIVQNNDSSPEEFESFSLHREKIINGNSKATIIIGPLSPGEYEYFGEFNPSTAQGKILVK